MFISKVVLSCWLESCSNVSQRLFCSFFLTLDKSLKDILDKVLSSGYFDRAQTHQNGACGEEETPEEQTEVADSAAVGEQPLQPGMQQCSDG